MRERERQRERMRERDSERECVYVRACVRACLCGCVCVQGELGEERHTGQHSSTHRERCKMCPSFKCVGFFRNFNNMT